MGSKDVTTTGIFLGGSSKRKKVGAEAWLWTTEITGSGDSIKTILLAADWEKAGEEGGGGMLTKNEGKRTVQWVSRQKK